MSTQTESTNLNNVSVPDATAQNSQTTSAREIRLRPAVDLVDAQSELILTVEMPGVSHESVTVSLERNELNIVGTADLSGPQNSRCLAGLPGPRVYERAFRLSDDIDRGAIDAQVSQGVLTLRLPKLHLSQKVSIPVKGE